MGNVGNGILYVSLFVIAGMSGYGLHGLTKKDNSDNGQAATRNIATLTLHKELACDDKGIALKAGLTRGGQIVWKKSVSEIVHMEGSVKLQTNKKEEQMLPIINLVAEPGRLKRIVMIDCGSETHALDMKHETKESLAGYFLAENRRHAMKLVHRKSPKALFRNIAEIRLY